MAYFSTTLQTFWRSLVILLYHIKCFFSQSPGQCTLAYWKNRAGDSRSVWLQPVRYQDQDIRILQALTHSKGWTSVSFVHCIHREATPPSLMLEHGDKSYLFLPPKLSLSSLEPAGEVSNYLQVSFKASVIWSSPGGKQDTGRVCSKGKISHVPRSAFRLNS